MEVLMCAYCASSECRGCCSVIVGGCKLNGTTRVCSLDHTVRRLWTTVVVGWVGKRWRAGIFYFVKIDEDMS
jgi:hypothetical protein